MASVSTYLPLLLRGAGVTLELTAASAALALVFSFIGGLGRLSRYRAVRVLAGIYIEFFRGTSLLIQLFWGFYVLPLLGLTLTPFQVAIAVFSLNLGAYGSEVVRGGIQAVPTGQTDAAVALAFTGWQRFRLVILPQALQLMVAPFGNLLIILLKATSLASLITISDLTFNGDTLRSTTGDSTTIFLLVLVMYFVMSSVISLGVRGLEWRLSVRHGRVKLPTPLEPEREGLL